MTSTVPNAPPVEIVTHGPDVMPDPCSIEHIVILTGSDATKLSSVDPAGTISAWRGRHGHDDDKGEPLTLDISSEQGLVRTSYSCIEKKRSFFELLRLARRHAEIHASDEPAAVTLLLVDLDEATALRAAEACVLALLASRAEMPRLLGKPSDHSPLERIEIHGLAGPAPCQRWLAAHAGNSLARYLTTLPSNHLRPGDYRTRIAGLADREGWQVDVLDRARLERAGAGAFLAVCRGSGNDDAAIVRLRYRPEVAKTNGTLALVGKGICFDTGGVNLKPARHMHGMHEDMQGSAVALGTLLALSRLEAPFAIDCWLALAVNDIGPDAFRQNEVVAASDGTTIEVVHTDAEGRMVLADTLVLASRESPTVMIDYATLTGACVYALGTRYSGACTNRDELREAIVAAGRHSGERVWPFPFDEDYDEAIESKIADVRQCSLEGEADQIVAARFLQRFVHDRPWIHLDLSAGNHKGGLGHVPTDISGFGVLFSLALVLDEGLMTKVSPDGDGQ